MSDGGLANSFKLNMRSFLRKMFGLRNQRSLVSKGEGHYIIQAYHTLNARESRYGILCLEEAPGPVRLPDHLGVRVGPRPVVAVGVGHTRVMALVGGGNPVAVAVAGDVVAKHQEIGQVAV